jgi:preprotein translocase subunit SecA
MFKNIFNSNNRKVNKLKKRVEKIKVYENTITEYSDEELKDYFKNLKEPELEEVFAIVKEATKRTLGFITHDVQLIGGIVLSEGNIPEMKTGEGKTLVAVAPAIYNSFFGKVHIITVNDYLAKRDAESMKAIYDYLGIDIGIVTSTTINKKEEYNKKIIYVTNSEIAFDYLRDNLALELEQQVLSNTFDYAIVDEVDSILIDEARSPLIISGLMEKKDNLLYKNANNIALSLTKGEEIKDKQGKIESMTGHFIIDEKSKNIYLTEEGIDFVEKELKIENLYEEDKNILFGHALNQSLIAHYCYVKDVDYIVKGEEVLIIDDNTGRISEGRRFSEGLHQAIEAKEHLEPKEENQTVASITYQNFFKKYKKLSGMTGTAQTEAVEFYEIYKLDVISIPTNKPMQRKDLKDIVYFSEKEKFNAIIENVLKINKTGQPILIGTTSIDKSEKIHLLLKEHNIKHEILNAKNHEREAEIISKAGELGSITIATNMAGRGVDIKIPKESLEKGGLYIIGSERHPSRRIDNQLRGRAGRQGDIGTSQFYLSLEDELLVKFGGEKIKTLTKILKLEEGESIESSMLNRAIENSQKQIEELHFEYRKNVVKYDDVNNEQRKVIYDIRQSILEKKFNIEEKTEEYIKEVSEYILMEIESLSEYNEDLEKELIINIFKDRYNIDVKNFVETNYKENYNETKKDLIPKIIITILEQKREMVEMPIEEFINIKRILLLQILDKEWKEHLHQLDLLSTGIGLRQYNQKDPVIEYKKESYHLFTTLIKKIKEEYVESLNRLSIMKKF